MQERLKKLLTIKSIVTLLFVICYLIMVMLWITGVATVPIPDQIATLVGMIVAFYFGTQKVSET